MSFSDTGVPQEATSWDEGLSPGMSPALLDKLRQGLLRVKVSPGMRAARMEPLSLPMYSWNPVAGSAGFGQAPTMTAFNWNNILFQGASTGATASGRTLVLGDNVTIQVSEGPTGTWTVTGLYFPGGGIDIIGGEISNTKPFDGLIDGYGILHSGTTNPTVSLNVPVYVGMCVVNATHDGSSTFTYDVAPTALTAEKQWRYKVVPVKIGHTGGATPTGLTTVLNDDVKMIEDLPGSPNFLYALNLNEWANTTGTASADWRAPGTRVDGVGYPSGFKYRYVGEDRTAGTSNPCLLPLWRCDSGGSHTYVFMSPNDHDGDCDAP